ncbi:conserved oligomeric Golgi complex subunit 1 [Prorops nasuta]|uniref:conserved oligomeric Golgi complex subunit 1 n=1 Tax=Prorops nasuta TaxID=863751 RepID=UPI0034CF48A3
MTLNYLHLDMDKVFKEYTIKEIEEIQVKIQLESERKKIELRTLVGERYRDLILAANTIGKMKITSQCATTRISTLQNTFKELQKKYLIGFKMESIENICERRPNENFDSAIIQVRILMNIPEYIWSAIDDQNFVSATQLFLVAKYLNYSLKFEIGDTEIQEKYPIIFKQWDVICQLKSIILYECNRTLQSLDVSAQSIASCLASLILLNEMSSLCLEKLISSRNSALLHVINKNDNSSVKNKIKLCVQILTETIHLIYLCFINNQDKEGLVIQYINNVQGFTIYSVLSKLNVNSKLIERFLPVITRDHKLATSEIKNEVLSSNFQESINLWLNWVKSFCINEITKLLELVTSVKGLFNIRENAINIELPKNWSLILQELALPKTNFWIEIFQPLITERAKCIINENWKEILRSLKLDVGDLLNRIVDDKFEYPEHDLQWFVWKDSSNDIPQKLTNADGLDKRSLLMKAKGFSPNVFSLCKNFDNNLLSLFLDLEQYLFEYQSSKTPTNLLSFNVSSQANSNSDCTQILVHLQKTSSSMLDDFINFVKTQCVVDKPEYGQYDINSIVLARFLLALTSLSPSLKQIFTLPNTAEMNVQDIKWQTICETLTEESNIIWSKWANMYKAKIHKHREKYMLKSALEDTEVFDMVIEWEKINIEEQSEEGRRIKSEILVPYQPSIALQKHLIAINQDLNKVIPHTIPKKIMHEIIESVATDLFQYYTHLSKNNMGQMQALQTLFDIKYITLLMVARENKVLHENLGKAYDSIRSKIDPFDYDAFQSFINTNVKKAIQRSLLILGNFIPHLEQLHSILGARNEYVMSEGGKSNPSTVLALCTGAPWFPPLAVTIPTRTLPAVTITATPDRLKRKKMATRENARSDTLTSTSIKSGAAAFFGAMSSDWFSTS